MTLQKMAIRDNEILPHNIKATLFNSAILASWTTHVMLNNNTICQFTLTRFPLQDQKHRNQINKLDTYAYFLTSNSLKGTSMHLTTINIDRQRQRGSVCISGETFQCQLQTDWSGNHRGLYPKDCTFFGVPMPHLRFGFAAPWEWILDIATEETANGVVVLSQGFKEMTGRRIPFLRNRRFFWSGEEMLYEVCESRHLPKREYVISGIAAEDLLIDPLLRHARYIRDGVTICWQFSPTPVFAHFQHGGWHFEIEQADIEVLVTWKQQDDSLPPPFSSCSRELSHLTAISTGQRRVYQTLEKQACLEPGESVQLPAGEIIFTGVNELADGTATLKNGLWDLALRRNSGQELVLGATRIMQLDTVVESATFPMLKPSLVRAIRSLKERMVFNVVPEDDPDQYYQWGTGTWPRCFSVLSLDAFGFIGEAYGYLKFMLDISKQFIPFDGFPHLWDNFTILGPRSNERLYDINGHAMKLYEAGKFYLRHRHDKYGRHLREDYYDILKGWCSWIEEHLNEDDVVLDETESNVWAHGYGTFSQAPAAAGIHLFRAMAEDHGQQQDSRHFAHIVERLLHGLHTILTGDAENPYLNIPAGVGRCYLTYLPQTPTQRNWWDQPVQKIGLSCYSLAAAFFLQDPDVSLLAPDDPVTAETLRLSLQLLGDEFDPRVLCWHLRNKEGHLGYGQGQLLLGLLYADEREEFRARLQALFDVSHREVGDPYLMQEVLARPGMPNRGNKAALTYYPILIDMLAGISAGKEPLTAFIPDLHVHKSRS